MIFKCQRLIVSYNLTDNFSVYYALWHIVFSRDNSVFLICGTDFIFGDHQRFLEATWEILLNELTRRTPWLWHMLFNPLIDHSTSKLFSSLFNKSTVQRSIIIKMGFWQRLNVFSSQRYNFIFSKLLLQQFFKIKIL